MNERKIKRNEISTLCKKIKMKMKSFFYHNMVRVCIQSTDRQKTQQMVFTLYIVFNPYKGYKNKYVFYSKRRNMK